MTTVTIELSVDQLLEAMRKLPQEERDALLKRLGAAEATRVSQEPGDPPGFGIWKNRVDITDSTKYAEQLRRETGQRQNERQTH